MRDKNLSFFQFRDSVQNYFQKRVSSDAQILRNPVLDNPTLLSDEYQIRFLSLKIQSLQGLSILSYFVPEIFGWKIRMSLYDYTKRLSLEDQIRVRILLVNLEIALLYIQDSEEYSLHDFFGNVLENGRKNLEGLRLVHRKPGPVTKPKWRRGYKDHGSLRSASDWLPSFDWSLTELQNLKERKEDIYSQLHRSLEDDLQRKYSLLLKETEKLE